MLKKQNRTSKQNKTKHPTQRSIRLQRVEESWREDLKDAGGESRQGAQQTSNAMQAEKEQCLSAEGKSKTATENYVIQQN